MPRIIKLTINNKTRQYTSLEKMYKSNPELKRLKYPIQEALSRRKQPYDKDGIKIERVFKDELIELKEWIIRNSNPDSTIKAFIITNKINEIIQSR